MRKSSSAVTLPRPAPPARQRCWLSQQMEIGNSTAFVEMQDTGKRRGTCGVSQWSAARETSRRASKLDEEGMEVVVCRHGVLLKALNMYRGEIFAHPMFLQSELMAAKPEFFAMDVACKYWPYLVKVASALPALKGLTNMKPFLSIMHARAHATKCENRLNGVVGTRREQGRPPERRRNRSIATSPVVP